jgi:hypothetical protein
MLRPHRADENTMTRRMEGCHRRLLIAVIVLASALPACRGAGGAMPEPSGPQLRVRAFSPGRDETITRSGVTKEQDAWRIEAAGAQTVRLFEIPAGADQSLLTYRAKLKASNVEGRAYLEMWVRIPGLGEFFSRGLAQPVSGTSDWATYETPFVLQKGQKPDLVKLNIVFESGNGTVWVRDAELLLTPLKG